MSKEKTRRKPVSNPNQPPSTIILHQPSPQIAHSRILQEQTPTNRNAKLLAKLLGNHQTHQAIHTQVRKTHIILEILQLEPRLGRNQLHGLGGRAVRVNGSSNLRLNHLLPDRLVNLDWLRLSHGRLPLNLNRLRLRLRTPSPLRGGVRGGGDAGSDIKGQAR